MRRLHWYQALAFVIVGAALLVGARVKARRVEHSDVITETTPAGYAWLKANLRGARMVVPDRPHAASEVSGHREGGRQIKRQRRFTVSTNSDRLRMPELSAKPAGRIRIAAVGDSVTFGWGLEEEQGWVHLLEGVLRERGHDVEILNAGLPGALPNSLAAWCAAELRRLGVDLVIFTRRFPPPPLGGSQALVEAIDTCAAQVPMRPLILLPPISRFDLHGIRVYQQEETELRAIFANRGWVVRDLTDAFRRAQGNRGASLRVQTDTAQLVDLENEKLLAESALGGEEELPAELAAYLDEHPEVAEAMMFDGGHPDAEGHAVLAELIAELLDPTSPQP